MVNLMLLRKRSGEPRNQCSRVAVYTMMQNTYGQQQRSKVSNRTESWLHRIAKTTWFRDHLASPSVLMTSCITTIHID
jgi:hypothetical protein